MPRLAEKDPLRPVDRSFFEVPIKRAAQKSKSHYIFGQSREQPKMLRVGLYSHVSTNEQQTLPIQMRAMHEYANRRGWTVAMQVREAERQMAGQAGHCCRTRCGNPETPSCRGEQLRNRTAARDRAHLRQTSSRCQRMKKPKRDPVREDRIENEAIVDARPEEQAMSWYYYLDGKVKFPFREVCRREGNLATPEG